MPHHNLARRRGLRSRMHQPQRARHHHRTRQLPPWILLAAIAAIATTFGFQQGRNMYNSATDKPAVIQAAAPRATSAVLEGRDYSFMASVNGQPIHWACDQPINIMLIGTSPSGSQETLQSVIGDLKSASGLPLTLGKPLVTRTMTHSTIAVYYAPNGTTIDNLSLNNDDELGVGGPIWNNEGVIISGKVLVRNDTPAADPRTSEGQHVLMHEIAHALGLGHAAEDTPEIMAPHSAPDDRPVLGEGDRTALTRIGCPH